MDIMDFVDYVNQYSLPILLLNQKKHWSTAEKYWEINILLRVDTKNLAKNGQKKFAPAANI